ncbi:MAG: hypothetical protein IPH32_18950 [Bacteroidetes bacterium]|nr:hypothetical protein [Bacteroidota bacterium]
MIKKQIDLASDVIDYVNTNNISVTSRALETPKLWRSNYKSKSALPYPKPVLKEKK